MRTSYVNAPPQLNVVVGSAADPGWPAIAAMRKELVLPLLWGQEGYPGPTREMVTLTRIGLEGPRDAIQCCCGILDLGNGPSKH